MTTAAQQPDSESAAAETPPPVTLTRRGFLSLSVAGAVALAAGAPLVLPPPESAFDAALEHGYSVRLAGARAERSKSFPQAMQVIIADARATLPAGTPFE